MTYLLTYATIGLTSGLYFHHRFPGLAWLSAGPQRTAAAMVGVFWPVAALVVLVIWVRGAVSESESKRGE